MFQIRGNYEIPSYISEVPVNPNGRVDNEQQKLIDVKTLIVDYANGKISYQELIQKLTQFNVPLRNMNGTITFELDGKMYNIKSNNYVETADESIFDRANDINLITNIFAKFRKGDIDIQALVNTLVDNGIIPKIGCNGKSMCVSLIYANKSYTVISNLLLPHVEEPVEPPVNVPVTPPSAGPLDPISDPLLSLNDGITTPTTTSPLTPVVGGSGNTTNQELTDNTIVQTDDIYSYNELRSKFSDDIINQYFEVTENGKDYKLKDNMTWSMFEAELLNRAADLNFDIDTSKFPGWEENKHDSLRSTSSYLSNYGGLCKRAAENAEDYLNTYLKPQLKEEFLSKYKTTLKQVGYTDDEIISIFEDIYSSSLYIITERIHQKMYTTGEVDLSYVSIDKKPLWVVCHVKPQGLIEEFMNEFTPKVKDFFVDAIMDRKYSADPEVLAEFVLALYAQETEGAEGFDITGADSTGSVTGASSSSVSSLDVLKELIGDDPETFAEAINAMTKELYRPMEEMMLPGQITAFCDFMSESNLEFNLDNFITLYAQFKGIGTLNINIGDIQVITMLYALICDKASGNDEESLESLLASGKTFAEVFESMEGVKTRGVDVDASYNIGNFFESWMKDCGKSAINDQWAKPAMKSALGFVAKKLPATAAKFIPGVGPALFAVDLVVTLGVKAIQAKKAGKDFTWKDAINVTINKCLGKTLGDLAKKIPAALFERSLKASVLHEVFRQRTGVDFAKTSSTVTKTLAKLFKLKLDIDIKDDTSDNPYTGGDGGYGGYSHDDGYEGYNGMSDWEYRWITEHTNDQGDGAVIITGPLTEIDFGGYGDGTTGGGGDEEESN